MRRIFVLAHRWVGLSIAGFLFLAGATGAVISWDHEIDDLLNGHLVKATTEGQPQPALALVAAVEARDPRRQVTYAPLVFEPGHSLSMFVEGRIDPKTGEPYSLGYNQVFVDPVSGEELGAREWGQVWPITRETFVSFLYKLHYTLHIPAFWGIQDWGIWLMGGIALLWTIDCFVGFYLTLPARPAPSRHHSAPAERAFARGRWERWKPAWKIKRGGSAYRMTFDIHRAFGLWTWALLFVLAFTAFSLNLYRPVFFPLMSLISDVTPTPFEQRSPAPDSRPIAARLGFEEIVALARVEGAKRGWSDPVGAIGYARSFGVYRVWYFAPGGDHGTAGLEPVQTYWDALDGRLLGQSVPWAGTAADIFLQVQFPIHSGRILGLPGRILVSLMGVVVAVLSVTGVLIWLRKTRARSARDAVRASAAPAE